MLRRQVTIINKLGMHARAAARFVQLASRFECDIKVSRNGREVNGKSIMGVMMLAAGSGSEIEIIVQGQDEALAMEHLEALVADKFGETE